MTIALWCLFIAAILHGVSKGPMGFYMAKEKGGYDNNTPREQAARLEGVGKRALAVHLNQIESFPLFAAGVLVATAASINVSAVDYLALAYVAARIIYIPLYLKDIATMRTLVWSIGYGSSLALMCSPAWA